MWDINRTQGPSHGSLRSSRLVDSANNTQLQDAGSGPATIGSSRVSRLASDQLIQLYYQNFHHAHPILLPQQAFNGPLGHQIPLHVMTVMRYIGAHYHRDPLVRETLREIAWEVLSDATLRDGFQVQSMLLLAIIAHAHGEYERASQTMQSAIDLALDLGMHRAIYSTQNSLQNPVIREMWQRTYWELYVVEAFLGALQEQNSFSLYQVQSDVNLPCDEAVYNAAEFIPQGHTLANLRENWPYSLQQHDFSSFAYRVDAVRLMGTVLAWNPSSGLENEAEMLERVDDALTEWLLHFPMSETNYLGEDGLFDEMIFQAQMIVYSAIIYLYRPRSTLAQISFDSRVSYELYASMLQFSSFDILDPYTGKLIRAADALSNLLTLPSPIKRHSPFLINGLAMSVLVHTAACVVSSSPQSEEPFKVRIELAAGALNRLAESWPLAGSVKEGLLRMYREAVQRFR